MPVFSKKELEDLKVQPVGNGLIDMICSPDNIDTFIDICNKKGVLIQGFTWWCHVTEEHRPCGMGGPWSLYYSGWFSEIEMGVVIELQDNESYREFFKNIWPNKPDYHPYYWPGFWLE